MNLKKLVLILLIACTTLSIVLGNVVSYARNLETSEEEYYLGVSRLRENSDGYYNGYILEENDGTGGLDLTSIWKIVSYEDENGGIPDFSQNIYCLEAEKGFTGNANDTSNIPRALENIVKYNLAFDMKNEKEDIMNYDFNLTNVQDYPEMYYQVLWILNNIYVKSNTDILLNASDFQNGEIGSDTNQEPSVTMEYEISKNKYELLDSIMINNNLSLSVDTNNKYSATIGAKSIWDAMAQTDSSNMSDPLTSEGIVKGTLDYLSDEEIDVIQQLAIWYLTNPTDTTYHTNENGLPKLPLLYVGNFIEDDWDSSLVDVLPPNATNYELWTTIYDGIYDDDDMPQNYGTRKVAFAEALYQYLILNAQELGTETYYDSIKGATATEVKFAETEPTFEDTQTGVIVGPFKTDVDGKFDINEISLKNQAGEEITEYLVLDSDKVVMAGTSSDLVKEAITNGVEFYISIPTPASTTTTKVDFAFSGLITKIDFLTVSTGPEANQPLVIVERIPVETSVSANRINLDLSLRKFIIRVETPVVNGPSIIREYNTENNNSREPDVITTPLDTGTDTTAIYNHHKNAVPVAIGDIVTYTIRVYNEGNVDGYVNEITDYLPEWLELYEETNGINSDYAWTVDSLDGRIIRTRITGTSTSAEEAAIGSLREAVYQNRILENATTFDTKLKAYDGQGALDFIEVQVKCKVIGENKAGDKILPETKITNIAEITEQTDENGVIVIEDRDSKPDSLTDEDVVKDNLPIDEELPNYKDAETENGEASGSPYYIPGQEDDDDFEKLVIQSFDLALKKFISGVSRVDGTTEDNADYTKAKEVTIEDREIKVQDTKPLQEGKLDAIYNKKTDAVGVKQYDLVEYTIRVFNEGTIDAKVKEIMDDVPTGLQYYSSVVDSIDYKWVLYREVKENETIPEEDIITYADVKYTKTTDATLATMIRTDYAAETILDAYKASVVLDENHHPVFDENNKEVVEWPEGLDYVDVKVMFKVIAPNSTSGEIINTAEITKHSDRDDDTTITDRDSTPNNKRIGEDDIDTDKIKLINFDLSLRKFITETKKNAEAETEIVNNRIPVVDTKPLDEGTGTTAIYEHTKEPKEVCVGSIVTYTIRVYNEGTMDGYASEVMDDLPKGITFLPTDQTNIDYRWKMYIEIKDEAGNVTSLVETDDVSKATIIKTDYLSKLVGEAAGRNNLLKGYNKEAGMTSDNYRDLKVAFIVDKPTTREGWDEIIINTAEITKHTDRDGTTIKDRDSTPNNRKIDEDDIDIEKIRIKPFDLALLKWVSEVEVTQDNKTTTTSTGNTVENARNENVPLVTIKSSNLNKVVVKFIYTIRIENQGEIEGYAKEVKDHIPEGLKFLPEDNPTWTVLDDKTIVTDSLKDTLLQPGQTEFLTVKFTWINGADNLGLKTNIAEISKDFNYYNDIDDIDSTPDSNGRVLRKPEEYEDDEDDAAVILTIQTGEVTGYIVVTTIVTTVLAAGLFGIKKFVL